MSDDDLTPIARSNTPSAEIKAMERMEIEYERRIRALEARVKELAEELTWAGGPSIRCETDGFDREVPTIVHLGCAHLEIVAQTTRAERAEAERDKWHGLANIRKEETDGLQARVKELEDALGTNRMCVNCTGGLHALCAGRLRCNCGCYTLQKYEPGNK